MNRKTKQKALDLELSFDESSNRWMIISYGGAGIPASNFEVSLWKEVISLRGQVNYLTERIKHLRDMVALLSKECDEK